MSGPGHSLRADLGWSIAAALIIGVYIAGAFAAAAGFPYPNAISVPELVRGIARTPLSAAARDEGGGFIGAWWLGGAVLAWTAYVGIRGAPRLRRWWPLVGAALPALPELLVPKYLLATIFYVSVAPLSTLLALAGAEHGEFYSEGFLCLTARGWWMILMLALWMRERRAARWRVHLCPRCFYDLRGLPADAPCPECGTVPTLSTM